MNAQLKLFNLDAGIKQRDLGIESVLSNNESFAARAREIAELICQRKGTVSIDDVREVLNEYEIEPDHCNAWGGIFRGKQWRQVGWTKSKLISNHARCVRRWQLTE